MKWLIRGKFWLVELRVFWWLIGGLCGYLIIFCVIVNWLGIG